MAKEKQLPEVKLTDPENKNPHSENESEDKTIEEVWEDFDSILDKALKTPAKSEEE